MIHLAGPRPVPRSRPAASVLAAAEESELHNELKTIWADGGIAHGGWLSIASSVTAEVMASVGFDYLCVDMQHGTTDYRTMYSMLQSMSASNSVPVVRVPWNEPGIIGRVLDAGALGVIVPMVNSVGEAAAAVQACRYPPEGARSWGPIRASRVYDEYSPAAANAAVACIPMIETAEAVESLDQILALDGIDAIYVGPADLSISYGQEPAADNPGEFAAALEHIVDSCRRHGVVPGIHTRPALAQKRRDQGFRMITVASDLLGLAAGAGEMLQGGTPDDAMY